MYVSAEHGLSPAALVQAPPAAPAPFPLSAPGRLYFYRARNAIYHLFRTLGFGDGGTVLVPDYHNSNEVLAIRAAGASVQFYRIGRNLEPDLEQLARLIKSTNPRALFVIHYFGWAQPMKDLITMCDERGLLLIEDCALCLLSETVEGPIGTFGDYATFCLYKTLPVPNGGVLVQNRRRLPSLERLPLGPCPVMTVGGRTLELLLEWLRNRSHVAGQASFGLKQAMGRLLRQLRVPRVPFGDIGFDFASVNLAMSSTSRRILERLDYETIRQRRRENFLQLRERLEGHATLFPRELEAGMCPLLFPILVRDKAAAARALQQRGVAAQEFWNFGVPETRGPEFADAQFLHDHILELPIHQDVTPAQVEYMAEQVLDLKLALS
ncbi:MAG TPA: DegT/DnrJ/EryC1/StrS family aminotransferase [Methylomirabilota bacterium]|jgi:dTDP-4-amino-4,6-dideoxygalactose transaminase|nr:DegT/DnrJ/EryC1/StrS family aminotransferase [Methylomirabilota bacterium]